MNEIRNEANGMTGIGPVLQHVEWRHIANLYRSRDIDRSACPFELLQKELGHSPSGWMVDFGSGAVIVDQGAGEIESKVYAENWFDAADKSLDWLAYVGSEKQWLSHTLTVEEDKAVVEELEMMVKQSLKFLGLRPSFESAICGDLEPTEDLTVFGAQAFHISHLEESLTKEWYEQDGDVFDLVADLGERWMVFNGLKNDGVAFVTLDVELDVVTQGAFNHLKDGKASWVLMCVDDGKNVHVSGLVNEKYHSDQQFNDEIEKEGLRVTQMFKLA